MRATHTESDTFNFIARKWNDAPGRMQSPILRDEKKKGSRKDRNIGFGVTMKSLLLNAEGTATVYPITTRPKEAMFNGLSTWDNGREESPAQP